MTSTETSTETNPDDIVTTFGTVLVKVDAANAQRSCGCGQSFS